MPSPTELPFDQLPGAVRAAATAIGAYLVETFPNTNGLRSAIIADIAPDDALKLMATIKPRIIYLSEMRFSAEDDIEGAISECRGLADEDEQSLRSDKRLISLQKHWQRHDGQLNVVLVAFMADGILHSTGSTSDWLDEFRDALRSLVADLQQEAEDREFDLHNTDTEEVREKAKVLAAHPSFSAGRTSLEKRTFLAEQLFPDLSPSALQRIAKRAENLEWLEKTGFVAGK